jgi:mannose-6-phosphate isomerase-like protein (cupin superfamily)
VAEPAERPWGTYTVLGEGNAFKVKTIEVRPGQTGVQ